MISRYTLYLMSVFCLACGGSQHATQRDYSSDEAELSNERESDEGGYYEDGSNQPTQAITTPAAPLTVIANPAYTQLRADDDALNHMFLSNSTGVDCDKAAELRNAICDLSNKICDNRSTTSDEQRCDDGKERCDRAKRAIAKVCSDT